MAVIGCDIEVGRVIGAEKLAEARAGIWTKTHFYEKGGFLHAKTFLVAAGEPTVLEFRVDLRPLMRAAARIHQRMHEEMSKKTGAPVVGFSFSKAWRSVKSTAKKIGKSKLVKAVGGAIKTVAKSKLVGSVLAVAAVAVPGVGVAALAAYGAANAAIKAVDKGKKLVQTASAAKSVITKAQTVAPKLAAAKVQAPLRVQAAVAASKTTATAQARAIAQRAVPAAAKAPTPQASALIRAQATAAAKAKIAAGQAQAKQAAANVVQQVKQAEAKVAPVVQAAAKIQAKLADPAVKARLLAIQKQADSAKKVLGEIKTNAQFGTGEQKLDAQKSAAIVNLVARNQARIQSMSQANAGGLPGLLIDGKGRIVPGRWRVMAKAAGRNADVLYQGPKSPSDAGSFSKIAGSPTVGVADHANWWTIEIRPPKSQRWVSLQPNGILFREHWQASKATDWYGKKGITAKAVIAKHTPTPGELRKLSARIGASPFPPLSPSQKRAKDAAYAAWLSKHAPKRQSRVGWADSPAWATTISGEDDDALTLEAEVSGHLKRLPQTGEVMPPGARVRFFLNQKSHSGKVLRAGGGSYTISYRPKAGETKAGSTKKHIAVIPKNDVYAVDARSVRMRSGGRDQFSDIGYAPPPAWATTIGCPCSDQGTEF